MLKLAGKRPERDRAQRSTRVTACPALLSATLCLDPSCHPTRSPPPPPGQERQRDFDFADFACARGLAQGHGAQNVGARRERQHQGARSRFCAQGPRGARLGGLGDRLRALCPTSLPSQRSPCSTGRPGPNCARERARPHRATAPRAVLVQCVANLMSLAIRSSVFGKVVYPSMADS